MKFSEVLPGGSTEQTFCSVRLAGILPKPKSNFLSTRRALWSQGTWRCVLASLLPFTRGFCRRSVSTGPGSDLPSASPWEPPADLCRDSCPRTSQLPASCSVGEGAHPSPGASGLPVEPLRCQVRFLLVKGSRQPRAGRHHELLRDLPTRRVRP